MSYLWKKSGMKLSNPFVITNDYVSAKYFCDREFETKVLLDNITNGRNSVLISPRRMGKSGLIGHLFAQARIQDSYRLFYVDLYATSSLAEMVFLLGRTITDSLKSDSRKGLESFLAVVKSLRPGFKVDPVTGHFVFDLSLGEITRPKDSLDEIFAYLNDTGTPCIVAIDEFQQIAEYPEKNVIAQIRTHVQKCLNARFIFSGSKRRMMERLFNNPSEPFYMSCTSLFLEAIDREKYRSFAKGLYAEAGKTLDDACFDDVYTRMEGHTWYVQRILNELFARTEPGGTAGAAMVSETIRYIVRLESRAYEELFSGFSQTQKQLLIAIACEGKASGITSTAFVKKHALKSPSTVQSAARVLYENETITKSGNRYSVTNRFFSLWLEWRYGSEGRL